jgi:putative flippase GtrA
MSLNHRENLRYILNGLTATAVHYGILTLNLRVLEISSAGISNFIAALFGISTSFLGSRYFVYRDHTGTLKKQAVSFLSLYLTIALLHGSALYLWTDRFGLPYQTGFLLATVIQVSLSYFGNKIFVFKNGHDHEN